MRPTRRHSPDPATHVGGEALHPALRRVWRDAETVQFGIDPEHAVVVGGLDEVSAQLVRELAGRRDGEGFADRAAELGADRERTASLMALLRASGVLTEPDTDGRVERGSPPRSRSGASPPQSPMSPKSPETEALSLLWGTEGGRRAMAARRLRVVQVVGAGRVGSAVAVLLAAAGIGCVVPVDDGPALAADASPAGFAAPLEAESRQAAVIARLAQCAPGVVSSVGSGGGASRGRGAGNHRPDLTVLAPDAAFADPVIVEDLLRRSVPHLLVTVRETTAVVGPLVVPGVTACLRCLHLHRVDRDPGWSRVAAQLAAPAPASPGDVVLATIAAAGAALQALSWLDGVAGLPVLDGCVETTLPMGTTRRRTWSPHPRCGCTWAQASGAKVPHR